MAKRKPKDREYSNYSPSQSSDPKPLSPQDNKRPDLNPGNKPDSKHLDDPTGF